ncbi:hypothetical protein D3C72_182800 [compost metagenome]
MRCIPLVAMASLILAAPAKASEPYLSASSASSKPGIGTGLTLSGARLEDRFAAESDAYSNASLWAAPGMIGLNDSRARTEGLPPASYNPWLAAGLTYVPALLGSALLLTVSGAPNEGTYRSGALLVTVNPTPGLGHFYLGEPTRGFTFFGIDMGLAAVTLAANLALYQGRRPASEPVPWQENLRNGITLTSIAGASLLSAWGAWDAYRIAEEKNEKALEP